MDHQEFLFVPFGRDDLERDSLKIIAEEYNSLVETRLDLAPAAARRTEIHSAR